MKKLLPVFAAILLCVLTFAACGSKGDVPQDTMAASPPTTTAASTTQAQTTEPATQAETTAAQGPVRAADLAPPALPAGYEPPPAELGIRGAFDPGDPITDADLITPHGYWPGMTMEEAYLLFPFDGYVINQPGPQDTDDYDFWLVSMNGVSYSFIKTVEGNPKSYADYILKYLSYYESQEPNSTPYVLRGVEWGDTAQQALDKLPGGGKARKWAFDQIMGQEWTPGSMTLIYNTSLGWHDLLLYTESAWISLVFGASGKLFMVSAGL